VSSVPFCVGSFAGEFPSCSSAAIQSSQSLSFRLICYPYGAKIAYGTWLLLATITFQQVARPNFPMISITFSPQFFVILIYIYHLLMSRHLLINLGIRGEKDNQILYTDGPSAHVPAFRR